MRVNFAVKQLRTTKALAWGIGVGQRSVERYRTGERKKPPEDIGDGIHTAVRACRQLQVSKCRRRQAVTSTGITVETRARFGCTAPIGTTDDGWFRRLAVHLPASYAQRLFDGREAGAGDRQMREVIAEGFKEGYFQDGGGRAVGLSDVAINDIDSGDLGF
ncbi:telomere-protecting terminal protein Tpg [Streptomyces sp. NPDC101227]|uniref:telomere-protecting terminal protein Tpg n=1 Tax=Streptomyces sp. NPDC101227 TaxID=3366136 RepID=UPI00381F29A5